MFFVQIFKKKSKPCPYTVYSRGEVFRLKKRLKMVEKIDLPKGNLLPVNVLTDDYYDEKFPDIQDNYVPIIPFMYNRVRCVHALFCEEKFEAIAIRTWLAGQIDPSPDFEWVSDLLKGRKKGVCFVTKNRYDKMYEESSAINKTLLHAIFRDRNNLKDVMKQTYEMYEAMAAKNKKIEDEKKKSEKWVMERHCYLNKRFSGLNTRETGLNEREWILRKGQRELKSSQKELNEQCEILIMKRLNLEGQITDFFGMKSAFMKKVISLLRLKREVQMVDRPEIATGRKMCIHYNELFEQKYLDCENCLERFSRNNGSSNYNSYLPQISYETQTSSSDEGYASKEEQKEWYNSPLNPYASVFRSNNN